MLSHDPEEAHPAALIGTPISVPVQYDMSDPQAFSDIDCSVMMSQTNCPCTPFFFSRYEVAEQTTVGSHAGCVGHCLNQDHARSQKWRLTFEEKLRHVGLKQTFSHKKCYFRGIGGRTRSNTPVKFPVGIGGSPDEISSYEVEGDHPLLFSRETMAQLGAKLYLSNCTVRFDHINVTSMKLLPHGVRSSCSKSHGFWEWFWTWVALSEESKVDRSELSSAVVDLEPDARCENLIPLGDSTDDHVAVSTVDPKYGPETFDKEANSWGGRRCISLSLSQEVQEACLGL